MSDIPAVVDVVFDVPDVGVVGEVSVHLHPHHLVPTTEDIKYVWNLRGQWRLRLNRGKRVSIIHLDLKNKNVFISFIYILFV